MDKLLTWEELAALIATMNEEHRKMPVLSQNGQTGAFFGFTGITFSDSEANPPDHPMLDDDNNWYYINKQGQPTRARHQPTDMKDFGESS